MLLGSRSTVPVTRASSREPAQAGGSRVERAERQQQRGESTMSRRPKHIANEGVRGH